MTNMSSLCRLGRVLIDSLKGKDSLAIYRHLDDLVVSAAFSRDRKHRYWLEMKLRKDGFPKTVCAVMQNPSYACEVVADKSVQFLERLVFEKAYPEFKGVGRLIVVNQYSYIQTNKFKGGPDKFSKKTDRYIMKGIVAADIILLAWGKSSRENERISTIKSFIRKTGGKEVIATKKHPSRGCYEDFICRVTDI